jgi:dolichol-phosphate mannosyltransferase
MKISIIIPVYNEELLIKSTIENIHSSLNRLSIIHEIIVIYDTCQDNTESILKNLQKNNSYLTVEKNKGLKGFGNSIQHGIEIARGEYVVLMMGDGCDDPEDLIRYYKKAEEGFDAVFGNRFMRGGSIIDYPLFKLLLNRLINFIICVLFYTTYSDTTNAFKLYRRNVILKLKPYVSVHYNITVELPIKIMTRGFNYAVLPNSWKNQNGLVTRLKVIKMANRYWFSILYCLLEKLLSGVDYKKNEKSF